MNFIKYIWEVNQNKSELIRITIFDLFRCKTICFISLFITNHGSNYSECMIHEGNC